MASSHDIEAAVKAGLAEGRRARQLVLALQPVRCRSCSVELDVDVDVNGGGLDDHYFRQWVDIAALDGCQFACVVGNDKGKGVTWPRGQHSFTLQANVMMPDSTQIVAALHLPPEAVKVVIHGDDTATWTCAQHPDGRSIIATYTAASQAAEVELTVHVLGTAVFTQRLVMNSRLHVL